MYNPTDRKFTLRTLPIEVRALFSFFLITIGVGYLFGLANLFLSDIAPHLGERITLPQAAIIKFYGNRGGTKLESALNGPMTGMLTPNEKYQVIKWIRGIPDGGGESEYNKIAPILQQRCISCHNKDSSLVPLTNYEEVSKVTEINLGTSIGTLARISHVHLFGLSILCMLTGTIFLFSAINAKIRFTVAVIPYLAIWIDIGSWWFTKYEPSFAYTVIIGGAFMGFCLAVQILVPLWEMWFGRKK